MLHLSGKSCQVDEEDMVRLKSIMLSNSPIILSRNSF